MRYGSGCLLLVCKEPLWSMQPGYDVYEKALFAALSGNVKKVLYRASGNYDRHYIIPSH